LHFTEPRRLTKGTLVANAILSIIFTSGFVAIALSFAFHYWQQANYKVAVGWSIAMVLSLALGALFYYLGNLPALPFDRRARIVVTGVNGTPVPGSQISGLLVYFTNHGKMAAKNCRFTGLVQIVSRGNALDPFPERAPADQSAALVEPNDPMVATFGRHGNYTFTDKDFEAFKTGEKTLHLQGRFQYEDFPECSHWTTFSRRLRADLTSEIDSKGNDADDNQCKSQPR
jgi:hypothetical protein